MLEQAVLGKADREIAGGMYVTHRTVRFYFATLFDKLGVHNRVDVALTGLLAHVATCDACMQAVIGFHGKAVDVTHS